MASRSPSLLALLGLAAIAGYQNRDKLPEIFGQLAGSASQARGNLAIDQMSRPGGFDIQSSLGNALGDASLGGVAGTLSGALSDLMHSATAAGSEASRKLDSWVGTGQNLAATGADIRAMVGEDTLNELADRTGLPLEELENRLASILPEAVNHLTPEGSIPPEYGSGQSAT